MAKSPAERKAEQRARQAKAGETKLEVFLDSQELEMLDYDCAARRPGRDSYSRAELVALMIRKYHGELMEKQEALSKRNCKKCCESLPVQNCPCEGDSRCWVTKGWHEVKLIV